MSNYFKRIVCSLAFGAVLSSVAYAQEAEDPAKVVPKLNIAWDCGKCTVNEKVIPLIEEAYRAEAAKSGRTVSATQSVDARIHDFRQRNPGTRVMLGIMAGKDRLGLKISYKGQEIAVSDYSANAVQGMNALCESVGQNAYKQVVAMFK